MLCAGGKRSWRQSSNRFRAVLSGTPALLNHRRPSTFSAARLGCGRTHLTVVFALFFLLLLNFENAQAQTADFALTVAPAEVTEGGSGAVTVEITNGVTFTTDETITLAFTGTAAADDFTVYDTNGRALASPYSLTLETGESVAAGLHHHHKRCRCGGRRDDHCCGQP